MLQLKSSVYIVNEWAFCFHEQVVSNAYTTQTREDGEAYIKTGGTDDISTTAHKTGAM